MTQKSHFWAYTEETRIERETCTPMFITVLFIIARTWKQPRCPSLDKWLRKLWCIYTMEYYSTIKNNTFESVLMKWKKLESIIQGFPGGSKDKASACNTGDLGSIPGSGRSLEKEMATQSSTLAWKSHGWRSLVGCSPWGCRVGHNWVPSLHFTSLLHVLSS